MEKTISVIIPTYNSERYIEKLIKCIQSHVNEIIICDSYSTDNTLEIAKSNNVRVIQHEYINSAKQKNWAIPQAQSEWVWIIDSDEIPENDLIKEILSFIDTVQPDIHLAYIPRVNLFWGHQLGKANAFPDYQSRLFRKKYGRYQDKEVHAQVRVKGQCVYLKNRLIHDDFKSISEWWLRNDRYYKYELDEFSKSEKAWSYKIQYIKPIYVFLNFYFIKGAYKYGFKGLFLSFQWFVYYFFVGAKIYEKEKIINRNNR